MNQELIDEMHKESPQPESKVTLRRTWKVEVTHSRFQDADYDRCVLIQEGKKAKVRRRGRGTSFDVKVCTHEPKRKTDVQS